jgi:hypothetical protein
MYGEFLVIVSESGVLVHMQIEDGCEVATADEVATVVHQIFAYAAGARC